MVYTTLMSKFTRKIQTDDLPDSYYRELIYKPLEKWESGEYEGNEEISIEDPPEKAQIFTAGQLAEKYDINIDVAEKISLYQHAALNDLNSEIDSLIRNSERYLQVKPYLNDKQYVRSIFQEYVRLSARSENFTRNNFNPLRNLKMAIIGGIISLALLTLFIFATVVFLDGGPLEQNLPALLFITVWLGWTIYALAWHVPRAYRTRKLVTKLHQESR